MHTHGSAPAAFRITCWQACCLCLMLSEPALWIVAEILNFSSSVGGWPAQQGTGLAALGLEWCAFGYPAALSPDQWYQLTHQPQPPKE